MPDISLFEKISVLSGLDRKELEDFARHAMPVHLEKGSYLFYRNDKSTGVYLLAEGSLQVIMDNEDNKEIIVYTINEGDIVGEMTMFSGAERSAAAVALEECRLYKLNNSKFIELMNLYPSIAVNLSKTLVDRLHAANSMIERLGMMDGTERVAHFLRALAMREGIERDEWLHLVKKPTYKQISQRLGVSEKTVYRTMQGLAKNGDIVIKGRQLALKKGFTNRLE